jgi:hypothetical protein
VEAECEFSIMSFVFMSSCKPRSIPATVENLSMAGFILDSCCSGGPWSLIIIPYTSKNHPAHRDCDEHLVPHLMAAAALFGHSKI